jgi:recombination protein RecA
MTEERQKPERSQKDLLSSLQYQAEKKFGKGALIRGDEVPNVPIMCSTGSYELDYVMGCLGIPAGRIFELYGPPSGGKTTLALIMMREVQKATNKAVGFIDAEYSFDRKWAANLGVDLSKEKFLYFQPPFGDDAFTMAEMMLKSGAVGLVVIDSVASLRPRAVAEGDYGDAHIAQLARLMSQGLEKITPEVANSPGSLICLNQIRNKINMIGYGNNETTSGGNALEFYSSIRWKVSRKEKLGPETSPYGFLTKIRVIKNKCGPPFREIELPLYIGTPVSVKHKVVDENGKAVLENGKSKEITSVIEGRFGINPYEEIINLAVEGNILKKKDHQTYFYNDAFVGQELTNTAYILEHEKQEIFKEIEARVKAEVLVIAKADASEEGSFHDVTTNKA